VRNYKTNNPVIINDEYFGIDDDPRINGCMPRLRSILGNVDKIKVNANCENTTFIRRIRKSTIITRKRTEDIISMQNISDFDDQDQLLMGRSMHLWAFDGFEKHFHKLFNEDSSALFQNETIYPTYINEKLAFELSESLVYEILSYKEFEQSLNKAKDDELIKTGTRKFKTVLKESDELDNYEIEDEFVYENDPREGRGLKRMKHFSESSSHRLCKTTRRDLKDCMKFTTVLTEVEETQKNILERAASILSMSSNYFYEEMRKNNTDDEEDNLY
jgi:hypothetical protein